MLHCTVGSCLNKSREGVHQKKSIVIPIVASVASVVVLIAALMIFCVIRNKNPSNDEGILDIFID